MNNNKSIFLSIIIPFYNRQELVYEVIKNLAAFDLDDIEIILVDDGSKDNTYQKLQSFKNYQKAKIKIYKQENKGPGGARNLGLQHANGKYVWFVDSDDYISIKAYNFLKQKDSENFDFIDFNLIRYQDKVINSIQLQPGFYLVNDEIRLKLLEKFGALYTKIFNKNFLATINFAYPENCVNEDYYIYFILPFYIKSFIKTDIVSYIYNDQTESVTRHKAFNNRLFGRQLSAYNGLVEARKHIHNQKHVDILFHKYERLFYFSALYIFYEPNWQGLKRILILKKVLENEYASLQNIYSPFVLNRTNFNLTGKSKIIEKIIQFIPRKNLKIDTIYEINNSNWKNDVYYPFK